MTLFVVLLLVLGGIAYANRKCRLATEKADAAKLKAEATAALAKIEADVRYVIRLARKIEKLRNRMNYQLNLVYGILEKQQEEINELKAHIQELRDGVLRGSDASARRTSYGTLGG